MSTEPPPPASPSNPPPGPEAPFPPGYGVPPPGYGVPPPGYGVPPPGYYPPPGYGVPPPGYVLPGYYPPPGYMPPGYLVPPGYYAPGFAPPGYVPPGYGPAIAAVPPATGSLLRAWATLATRPTLHNFAAWAQRADASWVTLSFVTAGLLTLVGAAVGVTSSFVSQSAFLNQPAPTTIGANGLLVSNLALLLVVGLVSAAVAVGYQFLLVLSLAIFSPRALGTMRQRYARVLRPYALALPGSVLGQALITLVFDALLYGGYYFFLRGASQNTLTLLPLLSLLGLIPTLVSAAYTYLLTIQAGAVGTTLHRGVVFAILIGTSVVLTITLYLISAILLLVFLAAFVSHLR